MKNWLRRALIEFLGLDEIRDRALDAQNAVDKIGNHLGLWSRITAGKLSAMTITADKLVVPPRLAPICGYTYRLRNGSTAGPILPRGERFGVANWAEGTWDYRGQHGSGDRMMDLVEVVGIKLEPTPPWKTPVKEYQSAEEVEQNEAARQALSKLIDVFEARGLHGSANIVRDFLDDY